VADLTRALELSKAEPISKIFASCEMETKKATSEEKPWCMNSEGLHDSPNASNKILSSGCVTGSPPSLSGNGAGVELQASRAADSKETRAIARLLDVATRANARQRKVVRMVMIQKINTCLPFLSAG
jgi:hypothetical protein